MTAEGHSPRTDEGGLVESEGVNAGSRAFADEGTDGGTEDGGRDRDVRRGVVRGDGPPLPDGSPGNPAASPAGLLGPPDQEPDAQDQGLTAGGGFEGATGRR